MAFMSWTKITTKHCKYRLQAQTLDEGKAHINLACVAGVKRGRGRGNLVAREDVGRAREKGKERLQGRHCFLRFSRSDSERENSDCSELIKFQSFDFFRLVEINITPFEKLNICR